MRGARGGLRAAQRKLYDPDPAGRAEGVREIGEYAEARWADDPRGVREIVRRFIWALSEESGATPWGAPEAVAEIVARIPELRPDFAGMFLGWLDHPETYLGNEILDAGTIWGIGRLGPGAPFTAEAVAAALAPFADHPSPLVRAAVAFARERHGLGG